MELLAAVDPGVATGSLLIALPLALIAGLISFASPCVLPLVPAYLALVAGLAGTGVDAGAQLEGGAKAKTASTMRATVGALLFVLGFTVVFVAVGTAIGALGQIFITQHSWITRVIGAFTIILGLVFMGAFDRVGFVQRDLRLHRVPRSGLIGAPLLGVAFGLGWTPCIGPMLAAVLGLASSTATAGRGAIMLFAYCLGLGIPFVAFALLSGRAFDVMAPIKRHYRAVRLVGGGILVILGFLELTGWWTNVIVWIQTSIPWQPTLPL